MSGTFVVAESGVDPLLDRPRDWPEEYRLGVANGLLLSPDGNLEMRPSFAPVLASIVAQMRPEDWAEVVDLVVAAPVMLYLAVDQTRLDGIRTALEYQAQSLPEGYRAGWARLASKFSEAQPRPSFQ